MKAENTRYKKILVFSAFTLDFCESREYYKKQRKQDCFLLLIFLFDNGRKEA